jgi:hypothetical protein
VFSRRTLTALLLVAAAGTWLACTVKYGVELSPVTDAGADVGAVDAAADVVDAGTPLAKVPPRPAADDATGKDLNLILAIEWWSGVPEADSGITEERSGYDLDGVETCPGLETCAPPANVDPTAKCDGPGGRDNAFLRLLKRFSADELRNGIADNVTRGDTTVLFLVEGYNGGKNDRQVTVRSIVSAGSQPMLPDGGPDHDGARVAPKRDGTDYWRLSNDALSNPPPAGTPCGQNGDVCKALGADTEAYVADGIFVARADFPITLPQFGPSARVDVRSGFVTARIVDLGAGSFRLDDGQVVGRIRPDELMGVVSLFNDPFAAGKPICSNALSLGVAKTTVCTFRDIHADLSKDGVQEPCDALSGAFFFRASPAKFGTVSPFPPPDGGRTCPPDLDLRCPK